MQHKVVIIACNTKREEHDETNDFKAHKIQQKPTDFFSRRIDEIIILALHGIIHLPGVLLVVIIHYDSFGVSFACRVLSKVIPGTWYLVRSICTFFWNANNMVAGLHG